MAGLRTLVVDWGGVLTVGLDVGMRTWADLEGVDPGHFRTVMRRWSGLDGAGTVTGSTSAQRPGDSLRNHPTSAIDPVLNPAAAIERGELTVPDFEVQLAAALTEVSGRSIIADGLLKRIFTGFEHAPAMNALVWRARRAGLRTGLLSNSWGDHYIRDDWAEMFDAVTISGEVGMRKPDPEIYLHACEQLESTPQECVFVDDLRVNVEAAAELGMVGVHHRTYDETAMELEALFGVPLAE